MERGEMKKVQFEAYEHDIVYILNCICLTKEILKNGRSELFERYFKKELYNTYMYDLTLIQKLMGYKANRELYNFNDYDLFVSHHEYLNIGDREFKYLFGKQRLERIKEINKEILYKKKITKFNEIQKNIKNKFFTKKWFLQKNA